MSSLFFAASGGRTQKLDLPPVAVFGSLTAILAVGLGLACAVDYRAALLIFAIVATPPIWVALTRRSSAILAITLPVICAGLLVPHAVTAGADVMLIIFIGWATTKAALSKDERWLVGVACLGVPFLWLLFGVNPNVPDWNTAILGARKTTFFLLGLALGALWPSTTRQYAEEVLIRLLVAAGAVSLGLHVLFPHIEASFPRQANVYTSLFEGQERMQGIFAGPFHVSLLGCFLLLRGWHIILVRSRPLKEAAVLSVLGALLLWLAEVRTGYVALALGVALTLLASGIPGWLNTRGRIWGRTALLLVVVALVISSGLISNNAISSLPHLTSDSRALGRISTWAQGATMISRSPIFGWGPGAAGAAVGARYDAGLHVTAHDQYLGFAIEGGLLGLIAIAFAGVTFMRQKPKILALDRPSSAAAFSLFGFSLTGDISEALPVSLILLILVGLTVHKSKRQLIETQLEWRD